jgi:putative transposase
MRYRRMDVASATYFFTLVTYRRQPLLADAGAIALFESVVKSVQGKRPFAVEAQVVLPDHLHAMWTLPDGDADYSTRWRLIKEGFTREYARRHSLPRPDPARKARGERTVWQRRFWEHLIRDDRDFSAHLEYIHFNPVKHGLASAPRDWPFSSFSQWVARGAYDEDWGSNEMPKLPDWAGRE